jgi:hypothetical protein
MILQTLLLNLLMVAVTPVNVLVVHFPAKGKVSTPLGPNGKADVERLGTVTRTEIQLDGIQPSHSALPGMNAYVAWAISPEGSFENLGELNISGSKGTLEATTRFDRFGILITAEPHYMVDRPSFAIIYKNEAPRGVRSVPLTVQIGEYEYRGLPQAPQGVLNIPSLVMEARAAVAIAASAQADRLAESEYRQAKVSLDTMEELVRRASPLDVIAPSAHEAIRRAHRAFTISRQSAR